MEKKKKYETPHTLVLTTTQTKILAASQPPDAGAKDMTQDSSWEEEESSVLDFSNSSDSEE